MANLTNTMVCWNDDSGQVELIPWPGHARGRHLRMSAGACWKEVRELSFADRKLHALELALTMIVRDNCDPAAVHRAMCGLEEYQAALPEDMVKLSAALFDMILPRLEHPIEEILASLDRQASALEEDARRRFGARDFTAEGPADDAERLRDAEEFLKGLSSRSQASRAHARFGRPEGDA